MEPDVVVVEPSRPDATAFARYAGVVIAVLSALGLVGGLIVVESLADDARSSVSVSQSALQAMSETVETIDEVALDTSASLGAASRSVGEVSATVDEAVTALEGVADFLEMELPDTLDAIQMSLPAAIQTANAVDGTLRALSLFGVDYDPVEPFGDSLSRVNTAIASLPDELRAQSDAIRSLIPSTSQLAVEADLLSESMSDLEQSLDGFVDLTDTYEVTVADAEATIDATGSSIDSSIWTIRTLVVGAGLIGIVAGAALAALGAHVAAVNARLDAIDIVRDHEVVT